MGKQLHACSKGYYKGAMVRGKSGVKWGTCPDLLCVGRSGSLVVVLLSLPDVGLSMDVAMVPRCASLLANLKEKRNTQ